MIHTIIQILHQVEAILITTSEGYKLDKKKRKGKKIVDISNWKIEFEKHLSNGNEFEIHTR